jgi:hypothetical protein
MSATHRLMHALLLPARLRTAVLSALASRKLSCLLDWRAVDVEADLLAGLSVPLALRIRCLLLICGPVRWDAGDRRVVTGFVADA